MTSMRGNGVSGPYISSTSLDRGSLKYGFQKECTLALANAPYKLFSPLTTKFAGGADVNDNNYMFRKEAKANN